MSKRIDIVKGTFTDYFENGSPAALLAAVTDDVVWRNTVPAWVAFGGVFRGRQGVQDYFAKADVLLETTAYAITDYTEGGDTVTAVGEETLRVRESGTTFSGTWCTVFRFRGDRIAEVIVIEDHSPLCIELAARKKT